jgi:hypothetical protein
LRPGETDDLAAPRLFGKNADQHGCSTDCVFFSSGDGKKFNKPSHLPGTLHCAGFAREP